MATLVGGIVQAETDTYYPFRDDIHHEMTFGNWHQRQVENVFSNPANLAGNKGLQALIGHHSGRLDTTTIYTAMQWLIGNVDFAIGIDTTFSDDIKEVVDGDYAPSQVGSFRDAYSTITVGSGIPINSEWTFGLKGQIRTRELFNESAVGLSGDIGLTWQGYPLSISVYTRSLIQSPLTWTTGLEESLAPRMIVETSYMFDPIQFYSGIQYSDQLEQVTGGVEWFMSPDMSLFGDVMVDAVSDTQSIRFGPYMSFNERFKMRYSYSTTQHSYATIQDHEIGFIITL
ncbi:hypothetical protein HOH87_04805 [bacterium]|nr:hypothetical protein [bacterium]